MKKTINIKYLVFIFIILGLTFILHTSAQQVISSAGAYSIGTNVQLSWTVGEPVIKSFTGGSTILTQGFQQGNLKVTPIEPVLMPGIFFSVYPNPVSYALILESSASGNPTLDYQLFNMEGKLIAKQRIKNQTEIIIMKNYSSGIYLLKIVMNNQQLLQTFKILKD